MKRIIRVPRVVRIAIGVVATALVFGASASALVRHAATNVEAVAALKVIESGSDRMLPLTVRAHDVARRWSAGPLRDDAVVMSILRAASAHGGLYDDERLYSARSWGALKGRRLWLSGEREQAANAWRRAGIGDLIMRLAALDKAQGNVTQALDEYDQALAVAPQSATVWIARGDLYERTKQWSLADDAYEHAMRFVPDDPRPYVAIAFSRWRRGLDDDNTERALEKAIQAALTDRQHRGDDALAWLYTDLALRYLQTDRVQPAMAAAQNAVHRDPTIPYAHFFLGEAHRLSRDPRRAVAELRRALDLGLVNEWARYSLAMAYLDLGDVRSARAEADRLRRVEPHFKALNLLFENIQKAKELR